MRFYGSKLLSGLLAAATVFTTVMALPLGVSAVSVKGQELSWSGAEKILSQIHDPEFPDYQVSVLDFGAVADGKTLCTDAFNEAIRQVNQKGGGTVVIPKGTYLTGAIRLLSNVNLHLADPQTVVKFTKETTEANYPLVFSHWEASECYNFSALIYANDQKNIAVTGKGILDGQANDEDTWWNWVNDGRQSGSRNKLVAMNNNKVPVQERVFGDGEYLRPNFFQVINCENVLVEDVTFKNSPMWEVNPVLSKNITVRGIHVDTIGHNNDGCDPESCNYVLIEDCYFNTGDDCIAIKSGRDEDGRKINTPSQNIVIRNNIFANGHGGITVGSEMTGGVKNVYADNNVLSSPDLNYALRFKTNAKRGGTIENIYLRNTTIKTVEIATMHATMLYEEGANGPYLPKFKNFKIENLKSTGGLYGFFVEAFDNSPIEGLVLRNVEINGCETPLRAMNWKNPTLDKVKINGQQFPCPTETRIEGVPAVGETVKADSLYIGGPLSDLTYTWKLADSRDGAYKQAATGKQLKITKAMEGKFLQLTAKDKKNRTGVSIAYEVLSALPSSGAPKGYSADSINRAAAKAILPEGFAVDAKPVSRLDLAKLLANAHGLTGTNAKYDIKDLPASDPAYPIVCAVLEKQFMTLKGQPSEKEAITDEGYVEDVKSGYFDPNGSITREEIGSVIMKSCGVNYKNCMGGTPIYNDLKDIDEDYYMDVARAQYFGLIYSESPKVLQPKKAVSNVEAAVIASRLSDFIGR